MLKARLQDEDKYRFLPPQQEHYERRSYGTVKCASD